MNRKERRQMVKSLQKTGMKREEAIKTVEDLRAKEEIQQIDPAIFVEGQKCQLLPFLNKNSGYSKEYSSWLEQHRDIVFTVKQFKDTPEGRKITLEEDITHQWHDCKLFTPVAVARIKMNDGTTQTVTLGSDIINSNDPHIQEMVQNLLKSQNEKEVSDNVSSN